MGKRINVILALFLFGCLLSGSHQAKAAYDTFVQVQCIKKLNLLKIDVFSGTSETGYGHYGKKQKQMWELHGIRNYLSMVGTMRLLNGDGTPSEDPRDDRMTEINPIETFCKLNANQPDGSKVSRSYDIHIEPAFFNSDLQGQCGGAQTFAVTIKQDDKLLIDNVPLWYRCRAGSPGLEGRWDEKIDKIELDANASGHGGLTFSGSYMDMTEPRYGVISAIFDLERDMPITAEKVYVTSQSPSK